MTIPAVNTAVPAALGLLCLLGCDPGHLYHPVNLEEVVSETRWRGAVSESVSVVVGPIYFLSGYRDVTMSFRLIGDEPEGAAIIGASLTTKGHTYDGDVHVWRRDFKTADGEILMPGENLPVREFTVEWSLPDYLEEVFGPTITVHLQLETKGGNRHSIDVRYNRLGWFEIWRGGNAEPTRRIEGRKVEQSVARGDQSMSSC